MGGVGELLHLSLDLGDTERAVTQLYLAHMSLCSPPSVGNLILKTHQLFDGDAGRCEVQWHSAPTFCGSSLPGSVRPGRAILLWGCF